MNTTSLDHTKGVIVHGPQGCGKTRHSAALARHFGKGRVVDDYVPGGRLDEDTLALTDMPVTGPNAVDFATAMREAGLIGRP